MFLSFLDVLNKGEADYLNEKLQTRYEEAAACNFIKKETLAQVFSCEFCEISKNTFFFTEHLWWLLLVMSTLSQVFPTLDFLQNHRTVFGCNHNI